VDIKPGNTRGNNQYRQRPARNTAKQTVSHPGELTAQLSRPARPTPVNPAQLTVADTAPTEISCGAVWGTDCDRMVNSPHYTHQWFDGPDQWFDGPGICPGPTSIARTAGLAYIPAWLQSCIAHMDNHNALEILAANPHCTTAIMEKLSSDLNDNDLCWALAGNPNCPPALLSKLSQSGATARTHVAAHPACPPATLAALALDSDSDVRQMVAHNRHCPPELLEQLLHDPALQVQKTAADNQNVPRAALAMWQLAHS
jgi:hypothetical protein